MSYCGPAALEFLASQIRRDDPGESSHWRHYHKDFTVREDGTFSGLSGLGGCALPYRGARAIFHGAVQRKYRRMARGYPEFKRLDRIAASITEHQGRAYDLDVLRQAITLAFLGDSLPGLEKISVVAVIGDGFASMTTLLLESGFARQVVLVNLNKTLLVDLAYFQRWAADRGRKLALVTDASDLGQAMDDSGVSLIAIQAANHALLRQAPLDLVINIASMQEMDPPVIEAYFEDMRAVSAAKRLHFYCCNREEKRLPDGTVTKFADYPWRDSDQVLVDEQCPWHQQYYVTRPPFYRNYDGPIRHRLVRMS